MDRAALVVRKIVVDNVNCSVSKNYHSVIIYSHSCLSKPVGLSSAKMQKKIEIFWISLTFLVWTETLWTHPALRL